MNNAGKLCWHIRPFAAAWTDGTLNQITQRFIGAHVSRCRSCQKALAALKALTEKLQSLSHDSPAETLDADRWTTLESAWEELERRRPSNR